MFEGDSAGTCTGKFLLKMMGGRAEGLACADPVARTPFGGRRNSDCFLLIGNKHSSSLLVLKRL